MRYPTLPRGTTTDLAEEFLEGEPRPLDEEVKWEGQGSNVELPDLDALSSELEHELEQFQSSEDSKDADWFEGYAAAKLHAALRELPLNVLDDPAFWRYLTMGFFWWLVRWRQQSTFDSRDPARYLKYIDASQPAECVLTRMFLRAQIAEVAGDYSLSYAVPEGTDFWRSHIVRVSTGSAPTVARAFVREQAARRMTTDPLRAFARRLNRLTTNIVIQTYSEDDATSAIEELRVEE